MKRKFIPVAILKNGILYQDGHMVYTDKKGRWLYVSEDGMDTYLFDNAAQLINELYRRTDDDDFVITGWDMYPTRFEYLIDNAYNYYSTRFEQ